MSNTTRSQIPSIEVEGSQGGFLVSSDQIPDNLKPTHAVVSGGDYYVPIPLSTYEYGALIALAFFLVVVMLLLLYAFQRQRRVVRITPRVREEINNRRRRQEFSLDTSYGQSTAEEKQYYHVSNAINLRDQVTCNANDTSTWNNGCICDKPYWGPNCNRETSDINYKQAGNIVDPRDITVDYLGQPKRRVNHLSFSLDDQATCTGLCDDTEECNGVIWEPKRCTLFRDITVADGADLTYSILKDSDVYLKSRQGLIYRDRVFLFRDRIHPRYHLLSTDNIPDEGHRTAMRGHRYILNFYPTIAINQGDLTGIYSTRSFLPSNFHSLLNGGDTSEVYIHRPNEDISVPRSWHNRVIWVMYDRISC